MERMLFYTHSGLRYIVILVVVLTLIKLLTGLVGNGRWGKLDQVLGAATPIVFDIQLLLGIILWIVQQRWNGALPLASWEHPVTMILAIAVAHVTWSRTKKSSEDMAKFRTAFVGFLVAGLLMGLGVARITQMI